MHPEIDPTRKGLAMAESKLSLGLAASVVEAMFIIYLKFIKKKYSPIMSYHTTLNQSFDIFNNLIKSTKAKLNN